MDQSVPGGVVFDANIAGIDNDVQTTQETDQIGTREQESEANTSTDIIEVTGPDPAGRITDLVGKEKDPHRVLTILGNADLSKASVDEALANSPFEEVSEEEFAKRYPELAESETSHANTYDTNGQKQQDAHIVQLDAYRQEKQHAVNVTNDKTSETGISKDKKQEVSESSDLLPESVEDIQNATEKFLEKNPEIRTLVDKIMSLSPQERKDLVKEFNEKINDLIKNEKDSRKKQFISILKAILIFIFGEFFEEMESSLDKAAA